ncbi:MAG: hypothetical protein LR015_02665 [Verrucomicrobia bacterium]|nr:hypothetical protein [Verrucomicrobiota bacterium]
MGWALMPKARNHQQNYWIALTGKEPTLTEQWRHFIEFAGNLMQKLVLDRTNKPRFIYAANSSESDFEQVSQNPGGVLFGTFHIAESDLMGSMLCTLGRQIRMIRLQVGNSLDTEILERSFHGMVQFVYVNRPEEMLFAIKEALEQGHGVAMQCDRYEFGSKLERFEFLGENRYFPFTIYHLSALFRAPVCFSFALRRRKDGTIPAWIPPVFYPVGSRKEVLTAGKTHFQDVLFKVEAILREDPTVWFNFQPLNPTEIKAVDT